MRRLRRFFSDRRGSSDLTVYLLLTAAGAAMVGLTVPSLFKSSQAASNTFDKQVKVLERGAGGGSSSGGAESSPWSFNVGPDGVSASGPLGNSGVTGNIAIDGKGHVSGGVNGGGSQGGSQGGSNSHGIGGPIQSNTPIVGAGSSSGWDALGNKL